MVRVSNTHSLNFEANMIKHAIMEIELVDCYPNLSGTQKASE